MSREVFGNITLGAVLAVLFCGSSGAAPIELISKPLQPRPSTFGDSGDLELSADGKWAVFTSNGTGITTNEFDEFILNVFLKNLETGETTLLSRGTDGTASGNAHSFGARMSADGSFVIFESEADNLIDDDTNEGSDVMLYDRAAGTVSVVSRTTNGVAEGLSGAASITPNGRFILFESDATDLSPLDGNDTADLYLMERETGQIQLVTVNSNATAAASSLPTGFGIGAFEGSVSGDGRYVAFLSLGTNLVPGLPSPAGAQVYLRDMVGRTNAWLSRATSGAAASFVSSPVVSSNGAYVVFLSTNLEGTPSQTGDGFLYLYEIATGTREAVHNSAGQPFPVSEFSFSGNSQFIAFASSNQIYLCDISSDSARLISTNSSSTPAGGVSTSPQISDDGRYVLFTSTATDLAGSVSSDAYQLYRADTQTGEIVLLSRAADTSSGGNSDVLYPVVSGNGAVAGFMSYAGNLATNDNATLNDVFVVSTAGRSAVALVSSPYPGAFSSTAGGSSMLEGQALSADGRRLVFTSLAEDLVANDSNGARDVFLHDLSTGVTRLISVSTNGAQLPGSLSLIGVSRDANVVAFASSNLVNGTGARSIFIWDASSGTSTIGNILPSGEISPTIGDAVLSPDGRYLAFRPAIQGPINVRDLQEQSTVAVGLPSSPAAIVGFSPGGKYLISRTSGYFVVDWRKNVQVAYLLSADYLANGFSADDSLLVVPMRITPSASSLQLFEFDAGTNATTVATNVVTAAISADGSTIAYLSRTNNVSGDLTLYTYNVKTGTNSPLQIAGTNAFFRTTQISMSADGRFITFATTNALTAPVAGAFLDVFVYDRVLKTTTLASERLDPADRFGGASSPALSADGRVLAFDSSASDLVLNDRNFGGDVFVRRFTAVDADSDGLEDGWETLQFGSLNPAPDADADNDGISNRNEFRAGTDPNSATSRFEMETSPGQTSESLTISVPASPGRTYQLQHRASLVTGEWQDVGAPIVAFSNEMEFQAPVTAQGSGFFRVEIIE